MPSGFLGSKGRIMTDYVVSRLADDGEATEIGTWRDLPSIGQVKDQLALLGLCLETETLVCEGNGKVWELDLPEHGFPHWKAIPCLGFVYGPGGSQW